MIRKLKLSSTITVEALRANRSLRVHITGEISAGLRGEIHPGLRGDLSGLRGDVTGLWGNVSGLWGDVDECEISDEDRENGVDITGLVEPAE